jgi:hypothetical protein
VVLELVVFAQSIQLESSNAGEVSQAAPAAMLIFALDAITILEIDRLPMYFLLQALPFALCAVR